MIKLCKDKTGLTLIEIVMAVSIFAILTAIAIPSFLSIRAKLQKDLCINNLRQIKLAKEHWALEYNKDFTDTPLANEIDPYIRDNTTSLICPLDHNHSFATSYTINNVGTDPVCQVSTSHRL